MRCRQFSENAISATHAPMSNEKKKKKKKKMEDELVSG